MYIIVYENGVYATDGEGDPARTLKINNAQLFYSEAIAQKELDKRLDEIKGFRKFPNAKVECEHPLHNRQKSNKCGNCGEWLPRY